MPADQRTGPGVAVSLGADLNRSMCPPLTPLLIGALILVLVQAVRLSDFSTPGADLEGVFYLRDVADGQALLAAVEVAKAGSKQVTGG